MNKMDQQLEENLFFTAPVVIDSKTMQAMKDQILATIQRLTKKTASAPSEELVCLNIDLFKF
ncbi:MAG: hypothetical protein R2827_15580 [Bdellovibrionales bacterium]